MLLDFLSLKRIKTVRPTFCVFSVSIFPLSCRFSIFCLLLVTFPFHIANGHLVLNKVVVCCSVCEGPPSMERVQSDHKHTTTLFETKSTSSRLKMLNRPDNGEYSNRKNTQKVGLTVLILYHGK